MTPDYTPDLVHAVLLELCELRDMRLRVPRQETYLAHRRRSLLLSLLDDVERALEYLPPHLREAVRLHYEEALTHRAAAQVIGINVSAFFKRIDLAERTIAGFLSQR